MGAEVPSFAINIVARDFDITDPLRRRVETKIGSVLEKLGQDTISANVVLRLHKLPAHGSYEQLILYFKNFLCKRAHLCIVAAIFYYNQ